MGRLASENSAMDSINHQPRDMSAMDVIYAILLVVTSVNLDASVRDILLDHALTVALNARTESKDL